MPAVRAARLFTPPISYQTGTTSQPVLALPKVLANGQFQFLLNGAAGQNYTIQMSTNLGSTHWTSLYVTNCATSGSFCVTNGIPTGNARFYRVMVGP